MSRRESTPSHNRRLLLVKAVYWMLYRQTEQRLFYGWQSFLSSRSIHDTQCNDASSDSMLETTRNETHPATEHCPSTRDARYSSDMYFVERILFHINKKEFICHITLWYGSFAASSTAEASKCVQKTFITGYFSRWNRLRCTKNRHQWITEFIF